MKASESFKLIIFLLYTVFWQLLVWGGTFYIVFLLHNSPWWIALSVFLASNQFKPDRFGLNYTEEEMKENYDL